MRIPGCGTIVAEDDSEHVPRGAVPCFFKDRSSGHSFTVTTNQEEFKDVRIGRWFGTVVNTRLLVTGVLQFFGALASILTTVTYACVSFNCSVSMTTPIWSGLFYLATGGLAMEVQRKPNKLNVTTLVGLNIFSLLLGSCALLAYSLITTHAKALYTDQQRVGVYIAKGSSIMFTVQCLLASVYTLFLSWRGLRRYSGPHTQTYNRLAQGPDEDTNEHLMVTGEFSL